MKRDIVYARPGIKPLRYDMFMPKGARKYGVYYAAAMKAPFASVLY